MGIPFFGCVWHGGWGAFVKSSVAARLARTWPGGVRRDPRSHEALSSYTDGGGGKHEMYYQDAGAVAGKLDHLADTHPDIAGVSMWVMGQEAPGVWHAVRHVVHGRPATDEGARARPHSQQPGARSGIR